MNKPSAAQADAAVFVNEGIRVRAIETCFLCGKQGQPLYAGVRDQLFGVPGVWSLYRCADCDHVWLNPQPVREDMVKIYQTYMTHQHPAESPQPLSFFDKTMHSIRATGLGYNQLLPGRRWSWVGHTGGLVPPLKDLATGSLMFLPSSSRGRLLDVGCGNGGFLRQMQNLGWDVQGVEPDPEAARVALEVNRVPVVTGTLGEAGLPSASFDVVTMSHVIEHAPDPFLLLAECRRVLRQGGMLVSVTPNLQSFGHRIFRSSWRGLEVPRHFHLFSSKGLRAVAEAAKFRVKTLRTLTRMCMENYVYSCCAGWRGWDAWVTSGKSRRRLRLSALNFWVREEGRRLLGQPVGEELLLIAQNTME